MANWLKSMQQTFEYYVVNPSTWRDEKQLTNVRSCSISRDADTETLGSASISITDALDECYVRVYLVTIQNGVKEKHPLGTFLVQTPSSKFNGKVHDIVLDAYTPLIELKENNTDIGYSALIGDNVMNLAYRLAREHARAPVVETKSDKTLYFDFVANTDDTWLSYISDLISVDEKSLALDELGRILFEKKQDIASLQPIWTYDDDNSSILYPDISVNRDLYGIPNAVEVIYTKGLNILKSRVVNDDTDSPISIPNRGREIVYRTIDPELTGYPTQDIIDEYAKKLLKSLSTLEYTVTYSHGYCPVRLGDCVRLNYSKAGIDNVKAKVISQTISCTPGCKVTEKAVYTNSLWR